MDYQATNKRNSFALASMILGIASMLTATTIILPIPLAALSVLFAILAGRKRKAPAIPCIVGYSTSFVGFLLSLSLLISMITTIPKLLKDPAFRERLDTVSEQMYGESFDDMIEDLYGIDLDTLFDNE